jgi:hypothetical protein
VDPPGNEDDSYAEDRLRLRRDRYPGAPDSVFTAPDKLMRTLKGVMLNGLTRDIIEFEVELNKGAVPHFVEGMKVGMPGLRILQIVFHPDMSENELVTVLDSLISSYAALPCLILSGAVPPLHKRMRFPPNIGILNIQAKSFGDSSVPLLTKSGQFTRLHSLSIRGTSVASVGMRKIKMAHKEKKFHPMFKIASSPFDGYPGGHQYYDHEFLQMELVRSGKL